jgi:hypothetical protein
MLNQQVTCVALSHRTSLAVIILLVSVLFVIFAVKPCWKFVPMIVNAASFPYVSVGLMLVIPCESVRVVVLVGLGEPLMENMLAYTTY